MTKWIFGIFLCFSMFPKIFPAEKDILKEMESMVKSYEQKKCEGLKIAFSCGNKICEPGENEFKCPQDCLHIKLKSYNNLILCPSVKNVFYPRAKEEVSTLMKKASDQKTPVRIVGTRHTINQSLCSNDLILNMTKLNRIIGIDKFQGEEVVKVQPGVLLGDMADFLHKKGKALGYAYTGFRGISVGGAVANGSHGSALWGRISTIASLVRYFELVTPSGEIKVYSRDNTDQETWNALNTHLGLLGVVTEMGLKIRPQFKLEAKVDYLDDGRILLVGLMKAVNQCHFAQIHWYPASGKIIRVCAIETDKPVDKGAKFNYFESELKMGSRTLKTFKQLFQKASCNPDTECRLEKLRYELKEMYPPYLKMQGKFIPKLKPTDHVVGYSHNIVVTNVSEYYEQHYQFDVEVAIPARNLDKVMHFIRDYIKKFKVCFPTVGVMFRFATADSNNIMSNYSTDDDIPEGTPIVYIEFPVIVPVGWEKAYMDEYESRIRVLTEYIAQNFEGRPHFGKTYFKKFRPKAQKVARFEKVRKKFDPNGILLNEFWREIGFGYR